VAGALSRFCDRLLARFGDQILRVILYGSFARGEAHAESDVDVMIVVGWEFEKLPGELNIAIRLRSHTPARIGYEAIMRPRLAPARRTSSGSFVTPKPSSPKRANGWKKS